MSDLTRPIIGIENRTAQEVFDIMCDRFRAAERALAERAGGVKVKALEWNHGYASVMFGGGYLVTYYAGMKEPAKLETRGWWDGDPNGHFKTVDEAKAAAQADYERRILSCLTTEPAAPEGRQGAGPKVKYDGTGEDAIRNMPAAFIERAALDELRKSKTAMTVVCSGLLNQPFGDKVPLYTRPAEQAVTEAMVEAGARAIAQAWGENWECCCAERRGLDCDCGDAMTDERDGYDERLSREDCRMAARTALKAAMEAGR